MQGRKENIFTSTDKIKGFCSKVKLWQQHVINKNLNVFSLSQKCQGEMNTASLCKTAQKHLIILEEKLCFYFPSTA